MLTFQMMYAISMQFPMCWHNSNWQNSHRILLTLFLCTNVDICPYDIIPVSMNLTKTCRKSSWLVVGPPLWKIYEFVSWDDEVPNWMEKQKCSTKQVGICRSNPTHYDRPCPLSGWEDHELTSSNRWGEFAKKNATPKEIEKYVKVKSYLKI